MPGVLQDQREKRRERCAHNRKPLEYIEKKADSGGHRRKPKEYIQKCRERRAPTRTQRVVGKTPRARGAAKRTRGARARPRAWPRQARGARPPRKRPRAKGAPTKTLPQRPPPDIRNSSSLDFHFCLSPLISKLIANHYPRGRPPRLNFSLPRDI